MRVLKFELIVDVLWVALALWYLSTAQSYPPAGRLIPTVVAVITLIVSVFQLAGNFIPTLRPFTHHKPGKGGVMESDHPAQHTEESDPFQKKRADKRQLAAIGWAIGFLLAIWLIGFVWAIPLFFLVYFLIQGRRYWVLAIISAVVMWGLAWGVFVQLLSVPLPGGVLF